MSQDRFLENDDPSPEDIRVPDVVDFESRGLDLPAPEIDLGGDSVEATGKPLGPRRLALLREQMAEHQKQVEEQQTSDPEYVDEELAQQQRRIANLASRAAMSSDEDRQSAERALATQQDRESGGEPTQPETTSIPVDQVRRRDLRSQRETGAAESADEDPVVADDPATAEETVPTEEAVPAEEVGSEESEATSETAEAATETSTSQAATDDSNHDEAAEPAEPAKALDSQGLDLLEPSEYRRSSPAKAILLVLAAVVLLAIAVVVLMILL